jgi:hypothetical protein
MVETRQEILLVRHKRYLPMEHLWWLNKRTFDGTEGLECAPNVPCGDEIPRQIDKMSFGDETLVRKKKEAEGGRSCY